MNTIQRLHKNLSKNVFLNLIILGATPVFCMLVCIVITLSFLFNSAKTQVKQNVENILELVSISNQEKIDSSISGTNIFLQNENVFKYLLNENSMLSNETISEISKIITIYTNTFPYVDNVFICNQNADTIISSTGKHSISDYLNMHYSYSDYSEDYWQKPLFWTEQPHRILSPTVANSVNGSNSVLPIIIRDINEKKVSNYIIININLDKLIASISEIPTSPTKLYVLNCFTNKIFSNNQNEGVFHEIAPELYSELVKNSNRSFNFILNGQKHFIATYPNVVGLNGFVYFFAIPFKDLYDSLHWVYALIIILVFIFIVVLSFVLWKKTNKIYSPIRTLAKTLSVDNQSISFSDINSSASALTTRNQTLSNALPYAQEKYLINYLNSAEYTFDVPTQDLILQSLPFKHNLFASVIIQFYPTEQMFKTFNNEEYSNILQCFYGILKEMFLSCFDAFFLTTNTNSLSILLNLDNPIKKEQVKTIWNNVLDLLKYDRDYLKLYFGESGVYENLSGLKLAHDEALKNLKYIPYEDESYSKSSKRKSLISQTDDSKLYNLLVSNDTTAACDLITSYQSKLSTADLQTKKNFYAKILSTILRALQLKNISFTDLQKTDYEYIAEVLENQIAEAPNIVLELINKLNIYSEKKETKNIIPYIKENYNNKNLSLEFIALEFNTSPSYISVFVKNNLNLGFHEYVTNLRVSEAKSLLIKTDMPISDIAETVGFPSRTTFFRSFKQNTGLTPNEFRKTKPH